MMQMNILAAEQEPISHYFSSKERPKGRDAFSEVGHRTEVTGSPILEGALAYFDCRLLERHDGGDHTIFIGEIVAAGYREDAEPLLWYASGYRRLAHFGHDETLR